MDPRIVLVTGYLPLPCTHRSQERYLALGEQLLGLGLPSLAFLDGSARELRVPETCGKLPASREDCWLSRDAALAGLEVPPSGKDSPAYHCVTHQKTAWLAQALSCSAAELLVWVDFGTLHNPRIEPQHIVDYFQRLQPQAVDRVLAPSIWPLEPGSWIRHDFVNWYLAGGVLAVPRRMVRWLDAAVKEEARRFLLDQGRLTWEVNTWAEVARRHLHRFQFYRADHDETLFTGCPRIGAPAG